MIQNKFTAAAKVMLRRAEKEAERLGHTYIGPEHLLLAMTGEKDGVAGGILAGRGIHYASVHEQVEELSGAGGESRLSAEDMTPALCRVIEASASVAQKSINLSSKRLLLLLLAFSCWLLLKKVGGRTTYL